MQIEVVLNFTFISSFSICDYKWEILHQGVLDRFQSNMFGLGDSIARPREHSTRQRSIARGAISTGGEDHLRVQQLRAQAESARGGPAGTLQR